MNKNTYLYRWAAYASTLIFPFTAQADDNNASTSDEIVDLKPMVITGSAVPKRVEDSLSSVSLISDNELDKQSHSSLGQILASLPGISSTAFGAGAIRGFDAYRIRILESGLGTLDASETSADHATSIDPFFAESVEILRGPGTLLYGGSAIGGVIQLRDRRMARDQQQGSYAETLLSYDSARNGFAASAIAQQQIQDWEITASLSHHDFDDFDIPGFAESSAQRATEELEHDEDEHHEDEEHHKDEADHEHEEEAQGSVPNTFLKKTNSSIAASWFPNDNARISLGFFNTDQEYGIPGHSHEHHHEDAEEHEDDHHEAEEEHDHSETVWIDLQQWRLDLDAEWLFEDAWLNRLSLRMNYGDYTHKEIEGEQTGTRFDREGWNLRLEADHGSEDTHFGKWGLDASHSDFTATGEEALTPPTTTTDTAVFALEEWEWEGMTLNFGGRIERRSIDADADLPDYSGTAYSASAGALLPLSDTWSLSTTLAWSERHPEALELYADGAHAATRQYEIGDASLSRERSINGELSLRYENEGTRANISVFSYSFDNYLYAMPTNNEQAGFTVFRYQEAEARIRGVEAELNHRWQDASGNWWDIGSFFDSSKGQLKTDDSPLPRQPAQRIGASIQWRHQGFLLGSRAWYAFEQDRITINELPTESYVRWDLEASYEQPGASMDWTVFARINNLLDEEIRISTSPLKDLAPLPGRSIELGTRIKF